MSENIFDHLDDDLPEELTDFQRIAIPGGQGFAFDIRDENAVERIREQLEDGLAEARAGLDQKLAAERALYVRATQPGFFDYALTHEKAKMAPVVRAEFIAQAALERRIAAIEGLVSEKLCGLDVETTE